MTRLRLKVCLVIGHTERSPGCMSQSGDLSEFQVNEFLAQKVFARLEAVPNIDARLVYRTTYSRVIGAINDLNPDLIISFHCNAFNGLASGSEVLHASSSLDGLRFAKVLSYYLSQAVSLRNRGANSRPRLSRGGKLLYGTKAPCVIAEPFFLDNPKDLMAAKNNISELIDAYCSAIQEGMRTIPSIQLG